MSETIAFWEMIQGMFSAEFLADLLLQSGMAAILLSLVISVIVAVLGILPSIFITGANIILFGPLYGFLISWIGEIVGAAVSFYLYKFGFKKHTENLAAKYKILEKITSSEGLKAGILIFQGRLLPFFPSGLVTLAGALSNINFTTFLMATALGKLPSLALESLVSYDVVNLHENWLRLIIILIAIILLIPLLKKK